MYADTVRSIVKIPVIKSIAKAVAFVRRRYSTIHVSGQCNVAQSACGSSSKSGWDFAPKRTLPPEFHFYTSSSSSIAEFTRATQFLPAENILKAHGKRGGVQKGWMAILGLGWSPDRSLARGLV